MHICESATIDVFSIRRHLQLSSWLVSLFCPLQARCAINAVAGKTYRIGRLLRSHHQ